MTSFEPESMPETVNFISPIKIIVGDKVENFLNKI